MPLPSLSHRTAVMAPSLIRAVHDRRRPSSLNLGLGQPSLPVPEEILEEGIRRLKAGPMGYTANAGCLPLRERIAAHFRLPGREGPDSVVVTCGAQEAIFAVLTATLDAGDEIIVPDPAFPSYAAIATLLGAETIRVPRRAEVGFRLEVAAVIDALTPRTRVVVVNSPGNPTGTVDDRAAIQTLCEVAEERGLFILSDEVYADIYYGPDPAPSAPRYTTNAFLVGGLSKCCAMTGFRLGYVVGEPNRVVGALRAHHMASTCAPVLSQHMAEFVFEHPETLGAHRPIYQQRRTRALESLRRNIDLPFVEPEGAFYVLVDVSQHTDRSLDLALEILDTVDVITAPGAAFGDVTQRWLRLTFADEPEIFDEATQRIGAFLKSRAG